MSKKFFKQVKKDLQWGPELSREAPKLGALADSDEFSKIIGIADAVACVTIKTKSVPVQPAAPSTYNSKISEFTKQLAVSRPNLLPKDRIKLAREMYKEWKATQ